ncbi:interferon lambda receptor 1 [Labrus mixtus]|uniref:interferon lambda receptor 1 n=1 Tax=Labrus mixtus TaxID=508554 RepID=UPI0029C0E1D1|nr:interferon lambda receptor 1 [Labrus mixtus]
MKMWSMRVIILLLFCYSCLSTDNRNQKVYFDSRNFNNVLRWVPVEPAFPGQKVLYSVKYWSDAKEDQPYQMKVDCQNITALSCDLTAETPSVYDVHYRAQVYVNGSVHGRTTSFKPLAHTKLGPPSLSIYTTASSLHVKVSLPSGPNGVSVADIITRNKIGPSESFIVYVINITSPKWAAKVNQSKTGRFVINLKNNHTKYCGYVVYMPSAEWGRSKSEKALFCDKLQSNHRKILPWLLVSAALLLAVVIISIVSICYYMRGGKEKKMPKPLVTPFNPGHRVMDILDGNRHISKVDFNSQGEPTVYATIQVKPNVSAVEAGGYSPQDTWQGSDNSSEGTGAQSSTSNQEDTSAQSSEIYSVVAVHVPAEENQDGQQGATKERQTGNLPFPSSREDWEKGGNDPELTTHGVPIPELDSIESNAAMPLLLRTVRDSNGQLILPSLTFQSTTAGGEIKPLLSDLIDANKEGPSLASFQSFDSSEWSDSGCGDSTVNTPTHPYCNTNYCPSQPVVSYLQQGCQNTPSGDATFESGYKQNWMPTTLLGILSKDSCGYRRTEKLWPWAGSKTEEEEREDEEIHLGAWGIRIQE